MRPFFCYYGGKWRAAPLYPPPEHETIVEPFAGAAGYATRYPDRKVVLVEKDPIIAGLWRYLVKSSSSDIRRLPDMPLDGSTVDDLSVCQEARWLIGFWLNKGSSGPRKSPSKWMRDRIRPKSFWGPEIREIIASQVDAIKHWRVIEGSYEQAPEVEATWFVDPPYQGAGRHYRCSDLVLDDLTRWCQTRQGLTVVCENVGADWLPFVPFARIKGNESRRGGKTSMEAVFVRRQAASEVQIMEGSSATAHFLGQALDALPAQGARRNEMKTRRARGMVVGLDLSLRATACCAIPRKWNHDMRHVIVAHFGVELSRDASPDDRADRSIAISDLVLAFCQRVGASAVFVEDHAFGAGGANTTMIHEMTGDVKAHLRRKLGMAPIPIAASRARKVLLQKLPRSDIKAFTLRNVKRLPCTATWTGDEVDAFVIGNAGLMFNGGIAMTFPGK